MYALGRQYKIRVDDQVPFFQPVDFMAPIPIMANGGIENTMWGPLFEKAFAKFMGSYEKIATGGLATEAMRAIAQ